MRTIRIDKVSLGIIVLYVNGEMGEKLEELKH